MALTDKLTAIADAIRDKTGKTEEMTLDQMVTEIEGITTGGPDVDIDDFEWFNDGNTHIWISLQEERISPVLGVCLEGTVTVDWGDGTTPDVLTGTDRYTAVWTPTHNYASAGEYIITLTVDGKMWFYGNTASNAGSGILRQSSGADLRNQVYLNSITSVEVGQGVPIIDNNAFYRCRALENVFIPEGVDIYNRVFYGCESLKSVVIPEGAGSLSQQALYDCRSLESVVIPSSVTSIGDSALYGCSSLKSVVIPEGVKTITKTSFQACYSLESVVIPSSVTSIGAFAFYNCYSLRHVVIPEGVTSIGERAFYYCASLTRIFIPKNVATIGTYAFSGCNSLAFCDFSAHTSVPTLSSTTVFNSTPSDFKILVPASLYDEWIAETNWSTYAGQIVIKEGSVYQ